MNVGFSTTATMAELIKKDLVMKKKKNAGIFSKVDTFLVSVIEKMFKRSPISCSVVG